MLRGLLWLSVAALAQGHASQARFGIYDLQGAAPTADWVLANADHWCLCAVLWYGRVRAVGISRASSTRTTGRLGADRT